MLGLSQVVIAVLNLGKQKVIAHYTGTTGMGVLSLVNGFLFLLYTLGTFAIYSAVTRSISDYSARKDNEKCNAVAQAAAWWLTRIVLLSVMGVLLLAPWSTKILHPMISPWLFFWLVIPLPLYAIGNLWLAELKGLQEFRKVVCFLISSSVTLLLCTLILVWKWNVTGLVLSLSMGTVTFMISGWIFRPNLSHWPLKKDTEVLVPLVQYSGVVLTTNLLIYGTQYLIRWETVRTLGLDANGLVQSVLFFGVYFMMVQESINTYLFPKLSGLEKAEERHPELQRAVRWTGLMCLSGAIVLILWIEPLTRMLLSKDFLPIKEFVAPLLLGEVLRVMCWIMGIDFLAQNRMKVNFWLNVVYVALLTGGVFWGMHQYGLQGFAWAYLAAHAVYVLLNLGLLFYTSRFKLNYRNTLMIITGLIMTGLITFVRGLPWGLFWGWIPVAVWIILFVEPMEWSLAKDKWMRWRNSTQ